MNNLQNNNEIQDIIIKKLSYLLKYKLKKLNTIEIMILKNDYISNDYIDNILTKYIKTLNKKEQFIINNNYMNLRIME